jgi:hypothetical protein
MKLDFAGRLTVVDQTFSGHPEKVCVADGINL